MISNAEAIRSAFGRWRASRGRDVSIWWDIFADNISFRTATRGREPAGFTRSVDRKSALTVYFDYISLEMEMLDHQVEQVIEAGSRVVAVIEASWRIRRTGRILNMRSAKAFWFEDGKVVRVELFYDSALLLEHTTPSRRTPQSRGAVADPPSRRAFVDDHV